MCRGSVREEVFIALPFSHPRVFPSTRLPIPSPLPLHSVLPLPLPPPPPPPTPVHRVMPCSSLQPLPLRPLDASCSSWIYGDRNTFVGLVRASVGTPRLRGSCSPTSTKAYDIHSFCYNSSQVLARCLTTLTSPLCQSLQHHSSPTTRPESPYNQCYTRTHRPTLASQHHDCTISNAIHYRI